MILNNIKILALLFLLLPSVSYALPPEFTAIYVAETYGMSVAQATYKIEHKNNGIIFTQNSAPTGLAAFFSNDALSETSYLSQHNEQLLLDEYHYIQKGTKDNRDTHLKIQWKMSDDQKLTGRISGTAGESTIQLEVNMPVWDTLSFQIPIMMGSSSSTPSGEHAVLVKGKLEKYLFVTHEPENITINGNIIKTIKIERKSGDKNKPFFLWIAPELHNLPVKFEKWKKGKPHVTMLLNKATFPSDKNLRFEIEEDIDDL